MSNFEKTQALLAQNIDGNKMLLSDNQLTQLLTINTSSTPWSYAGAKAQILGITSGDATNKCGSVTFSRLVINALENKTKIGSGEPRNIKFTSKTVKFSDPLQASDGLTAWDMSRGLPLSATERFQKYYETASKANQRAIGQMVHENVCVEANKDKQWFEKDLLASAVTAQDAWDYAVSLADNMSLTQNTEFQIDGVDAGDIIIYASLPVATKISKAGLTGNRTELTFAGGSYSISTIGGYRMISNRFMPNDTQLVVSTTYSLGLSEKLLAFNTGTVGNSNDMEIYFEIAFLRDIIFTPLNFVVTKPTA